MATIEPGSVVRTEAFGGSLHERRAITSVVEGRDFPVVWVCSEQEWDLARAQGRDPEGIPWPAENVEPVS